MEQRASTSSRRRFLRGLAGATAAAAAAPALIAPTPARLVAAEPEPRAGDPAPAEGEKRGSPLRLSTSSIHFLHLPVEAACERIAKLGFEAVDVWSAYQGCPHLDDVADRLGSDGLKKVLAENRLKLFAFSVYVGGFPKYAELLGRAGGGVAIRGSTGPCDPGELRTRTKAFLESLAPEVELAERHGCRLAIENHGHALLDSIDSLKAFVDLNRSPRLGIALAPYHIQAGGMSVEEAIRICGKQLFFFYAWQHAEGTAQLPGIGKTDFTPWIAALEKAGYTGHLNAFMHGDLKPDEMAAALATSRDYLRDCHAKATKRA